MKKSKIISLMLVIIIFLEAILPISASIAINETVETNEITANYLEENTIKESDSENKVESQKETIESTSNNLEGEEENTETLKGVKENLSNLKESDSEESELEEGENEGLEGSNGTGNSVGTDKIVGTEEREGAEEIEEGMENSAGSDEESTTNSNSSKLEGEVGGTNEIEDTIAPIIEINNQGGSTYASLEICISVTDENSGLADTNEYAYYLSSSKTSLIDGEWKEYKNGTNFIIGENINGTRYLFVKEISDKAGNISKTNGEEITINNVSYLLIGTYEFNSEMEQGVNQYLGTSQILNTIIFDGQGTEENPYIVENVEQFLGIKDDLTKHYKLVTNLDLTDVEFSTFGNVENKFIGSFDGNGNIISNLNIVNENDYVGLFGYSEGEIKNLTLENVKVNGKNNVGAVVGYNNGQIKNVEIKNGIVEGNDNIGGIAGVNNGVITNVKVNGKVTGSNYVGGISGQSNDIIGCYIKNSITDTIVEGKNYIGGISGCAGEVEYCYAKGTTKGSENYVGGITGLLNANGSISKSQVVGNVEGNNSVGGIIGENTGIGVIENVFATASVLGNVNIGGIAGNVTHEFSLRRSYAIGKVYGNGSTGGLIGAGSSNTVIDSYWIAETTGQQVSNGGTKKTIEELEDEIEYASSWDFENTWDIKSGTIAYLKNMEIPNEVYISNIEIVDSLEGEGTEESPYIITTPEELIKIKIYGLDKCYKLGNNIDLGEYNWASIGSSEEPFTGTFDGDIYLISNLIINKQGNSYKGLFGYNKGTIKNVNITNVNIVAGNYIGAVAGGNEGTITNVIVTGGKIKGNEYIGGIVGNMIAGKISQCISNLNLNGNNIVGGIAGNNLGVIEKSYSKGNIYAISNGAGLVSLNLGTVLNCFSVSNVETVEDSGAGLIVETNGVVENCYAIGKVKNGNDGAGLTSAGNAVVNSYWVKELSKKSGSFSGSEKTVVELLNEKTYENWDFTAVWEIQEGKSFAYLKGMAVPDEILEVNLDYAEEMNGEGTKENPYIIMNAKQLAAIINNLDAHYKLGNNIDLSSYTEWLTIGNKNYKFKGSLDGAGFKISNLKIKYNADYVGLFGYSEGEFKNITLSNTNIVGNNYVGALVGYTTGNIENIKIDNGEISGKQYIGGIVGETTNNIANSSSNIVITGTSYVGGIVGKITGKIEKSFSLGSTTGTENHIGGLVGYCEGNIEKSYSIGKVIGSNYVGGISGSSGIINNCFTTSEVSGVNYVGGISGANSTVTCCYSIGEVKGTGISIGGLVGMDGVATNSYWTPETVKQTISSCGEKRSINQLILKNGYLDWDFDSVWEINENNGLAYLKELEVPEAIKVENLNTILFDSGKGTKENPFVITTVEQLKLINYGLNGHYKLGNNIDLKDISNWLPIGDSIYNFTGSFDGSGYKISNLSINEIEKSYVGLFGYSTGTLKNIVFENVKVKGKNYVGALVGYTTGNIENVSIIGGTVSGEDKVGGLVGCTYGNISNCNATADISGKQYVGGLIGENYSELVYNSHAIGNVIATSNSVGGLIGYSKATRITNCYATGNIVGNNDIGGLIGYNIKTTIEKCYATGNATGKNYVGGLVGDTSYTPVILNCFATGNVTGESRVGGLCGYTAKITNCYAIGKVVGTGNYVGGLTGTSCTAENSYWTPETTKQETSGSGKKSSIIKLLNKSGYTEWNFDDIWVIDETKTLAYLKDLTQPESIKAENIEGAVSIEGKGTEDEPYIIMIPEHMEIIANNLNEHYILGANIDLGTYSNWKSIGNKNYPFTGSFDGKGYTISNVTIEKSTTDTYTGLFGYSTGKIENVIIENINISSGNYTGALVGYTTGLINNVSVKNGIIIGNNRVGGIAGYSSSNIENSNSEVSVSGGSYVGGIVGESIGALISNCYSKKDIIGTSNNVGGIAGYLKATTFTKCYATGNITGVSGVGGLIGNNVKTPMQLSYATGNVLGTTFVGGLVGNTSGVPEITNCFSTGKVNGDSRVAGISGYISNVKNCYSTSEVTATEGYIGGLVGIEGTATDSYWTVSTLNEEDTVGKKVLRNELAVQSTYENWDFDTIWNIDENTSTAYLKDLVKPDNVNLDYVDNNNGIEGKGTEESPYIIKTVEELENIPFTGLNKYYKLGDDIDLSVKDNWTPIGSNLRKFSGHFDGNGYTISNLTIVGNSDYRGLFGYNSGTITNIKLVNSNISGNNYVGTIAGYSTGSVSYSRSTSVKVKGNNNVGGLVGNSTTKNISNCYVVGDVEGNEYVGGITGKSENILNCYSIGTVVGESNVGGITGTVSAQIQNCYSISTVVGKTNFGALVGNNSGSVIDSYWFPEINNNMSTNEGIAVPITKLSNSENCKNWDFDEVWGIKENATLPYLKNMSIPKEIYISNMDDNGLIEGNGTVDDPYILMDANDLNAVRLFGLEKHYMLGSDIDLSSYDNWSSIGTKESPFTGSLDGDDYIISNLLINGNSDYIGLFGYNSGALSNIEIENVNVSGKNYVGGLVGYNTGTISNVSIKNGKIEGQDYVGGLVGSQSGTITSSYTNITVQGNNYVGGLVGKNEGNVSKCYSAGSITGKSKVGGLLGYNSSEISDCYSISNIVITNETEDSYSGGLIGYMESSEDCLVNNCYAIGKITTIRIDNTVGGLIGYGNLEYVKNSYWVPETTSRLTSAGGINKNMSDMLLKATYSNWDFSSVWTIREGRTSAYLRNMEVPTGVYEENIDYVKFESGNGTIDNPYIIKNVKQLEAINIHLSCHFKLGADIDLISVDNWVPLGDLDNKFTGSLDGNGFTIRNLNISENERDNIGLFGYSNGTLNNILIENANVEGKNNVGILVGRNEGTINNVGIENSIVTGQENIGGLVGENSGNISKSYVSIEANGIHKVGGLVGKSEIGNIEKSYSVGEVTGSLDYIGGLIGENDSLVKNCYTTANVDGNNFVGGLIGNNLNNVENCYAIGIVKGTGIKLGGLIGGGASEEVANSYWTPETTEMLISSGGEMNLISLMTKKNGYKNWNFENIWTIQENSTIAYLKDLKAPDTVNVTPDAAFDSGDGTEENPYIIKTTEQLRMVGYILDKSYKLGADIDLSTYANWTPIGSSEYKFTGIFDGDGYEINGLTILSGDSYKGLFGYNEGTIKNVKLTNIDIQGGNYSGAIVGHNSGTIENINVLEGNIEGIDYVGAIVGYSSGKISNCSSEIDVQGNNYVGGVVGYIVDNALTNCYSVGSVVGNNYVGGLVGYSTAVIEKCYSTSNVLGTYSYIGGLIGKTTADVNNCFATGNVTSSLLYIGGLIGYTSSTINNCYSIGEVSGSNNNIGALTGEKCSAVSSYWNSKLSTQTQGISGTETGQANLLKQNTYINWDFNDIWSIDEDESTPYLMEFSKPSEVNIGLPDETAPETVEINTDETTSCVFKLNINLNDNESGVHTAKLYVNNELEVRYLYREKDVGPHEEVYIVENLKPNVEFEYYMVVTDFAGNTETTEIQKMKTKPINEVEFVPNTTEYTNLDVELTLKSEIYLGQKIQYSYDLQEWFDYTETLIIAENTKIYAKIIDGYNEGEITEYEINNIDKIVPTIIGRYEEGKLHLNINDYGVSKLLNWKYVITNENTDDPVYTNIIETSESVETVLSLTEYGVNYIYVLAEDNAGNIVKEKFGDYYIPSTQINVQIENISDRSEKIKLAGTEILIDGVKCNLTDEYGMTNTKLKGREKGIYEYTITETVAPVGYNLLEDNVKLYIEYNYYGEVINVTSNSNKVVIHGYSAQDIYLQIINDKKAVSEYGLVVKAVDNDNEEIVLENINYKISIDAESGEKISVIDVTNSEGKILLNEIDGTGNININIEQLSFIDKYIFNEKTISLNINIDSNTGEIKEQDIPKNIGFEIDNENKLIIVTIKNKKKDIENELSLQIQAEIDSICKGISDVEFILTQPKGLSKISGKTNEEGIVNFKGIAVLPKGEYEYIINSVEENNLVPSEIRVKIIYNENGEIVEVVEITTESESIVQNYIEDYDVIYNNYCINVVKKIVAETVNLTIEKCDENDNTKLLSGITYNITTMFEDLELIEEHTTDLNGTINVKIAKQDEITIKIQEINNIPGYVLNNVEKTIVLKLNNETGIYEVDTSLTDENMVIIIDNVTGDVLIKETSIKKIEQEQKGNISLYINKYDSKDETKALEGVEFVVTDVKNNKQYTVITYGGYAGLLDNIPVTQAGVYEFIVEEIRTVAGYELFKTPVKFEITYEIENDILTAKSVLITQGHQYLTYKNHYEYESDKYYQLDVILNFVNETAEESSEVEYRNLILTNISDKDNSILSNIDFNIKLLYENGTSINIYEKTDSNGIISSKIAIPNGKTKIEITQLSELDGYEKDDLIKVIELEKTENEIIVKSKENADNIDVKIDEENINMIFKNIVEDTSSDDVEEEEPGKIMFSILNKDSEFDNVRLINTEYNITVYEDLTETNIKTTSYMPIDENGCGSAVINKQILNSKNLYVINQFETPEGYEPIGPIGLIITTDENGNIIEAEISDSDNFVQGVCNIVKAEGKNIELELNNIRSLVPTYSLNVVAENSEERSIKVGNIEYLVNVIQENGADIRAEITTDIEGRAILEKLNGTGNIKIAIKQMNTSLGYTIDEEIFTATVVREEDGEYNITINEQLNNSIKVEIDNDNKIITMRVVVNPEFSMYLENIDGDDNSKKLNGTEFKIVAEDWIVGNYVTDENGEVYIKLGERNINKTVKYKLIQIKVTDGYELIELVEFDVKFNSDGKFENIDIIKGADNIEIVGDYYNKSFINLKLINYIIKDEEPGEDEEVDKDEGKDEDNDNDEDADKDGDENLPDDKLDGDSSSDNENINKPDDDTSDDSNQGSDKYNDKVDSDKSDDNENSDDFDDNKNEDLPKEIGDDENLDSHKGILKKIMDLLSKTSVKCGIIIIICIKVLLIIWLIVFKKRKKDEESK